MMKLRLFFILFLVAFSSKGHYTYAQRETIDIQILIAQKEDIYNKLIESYYNDVNNIELELFINIIEEWNNLFSQIIHPFDKNKDISLYYKWEAYNCQIIDLLDKFDLGFTDNQVKQWENNCKKLKKEYFKTHSNNNIPNNLKADPTKSQRNQRSTVPPTITNPHNNNFSNNKDLLDTYITCLTLPLAVKYHKDGIEMAYNALNNLIKNKFITNKEFIEMWNGYSHLLKNYEKYNKELIKLIESHRDLAKKKTPNKQSLTTIISGIENGPELTLREYGKFYKQDYSISYLDKIIDKYIGLLKEFASGKRHVDYRTFDVFINSYLK